MSAIPEDLDYLAARARARRGGLAEAQRLDGLCRLGSVEALCRAVLPGAEPSSAAEFQRRLTLAWLLELDELARGLGRRRARLVAAMAGRVAIEDRKAEARALSAGVPAEALCGLLLRPGAAPGARDPEELVPEASPPRRLELPRPLVLELALDRDSLRELVAALEDLARPDQRGVRALVRQEVDHYHLLLVVRGRFHHGLTPEALLPWHVEGAGIGRDRLARMLSAPALSGAVALAIGRVLDAVPSQEELTPAALDALAWRRYRRLAHRTLREGEMGFAALVGYAALRRVEVMNLATVSEGLRLGLPERIRSHLVPPAAEVARA